MASAKLYLDRRTIKGDGTSPLKLSITHKSVHFLLPLGVDIAPSQFDPRGGRNGRTWVPGASRNAYISSTLASVDEALLNINKTHTRNTASLKSYILSCLKGEDEEEVSATFAEYATKHMAHMGKRTREMYANTMRKVRMYCIARGEDYDTLLLDDIDKDWLQGYYHYMSEGLCQRVNTISIDLRNIRAIFNTAIDYDDSIRYPFRRFRIPREETPYRTLTLTQMRTFINAPCPSWAQKYKDTFLLMFYLIGINNTDMFDLRKGDIVNGRLVYQRAKTHKYYSVKIYPEALELINKLQGKGDWLLYPRDTYSNCNNYLHDLNDGLKAIASSIGGDFPRELTTYYARYSWANIAHRLTPTVPKDDISIALGHVIGGSKTTETYIDETLIKADEANRRVIDAVNGVCGV